MLGSSVRRVAYCIILLLIRCPSAASEGFEDSDDSEYTYNDQEDSHIEPLPRRSDSAVPELFFNSQINSNPHNYKYLINHPNVCLVHNEVFLIVLIRTIFPHYDRRMAIRETWGGQESFGNLTIKFIYLFAKPNDTRIQRAIWRESEIYEDVIQENFEESYENLTIKTVMAWRWVTKFCPHAKFVMVGDDAIVVDIFKLILYLKEQLIRKPYLDHFTLCYLFPCCTQAHHVSSIKYSVSRIKYPGTAYPDYCSGIGYISSPDILHKMLIMAQDTPSFMPDDAWIGVLAEKLGVKFLDTYTSYAGISKRDSVVLDFMDTNYRNSPIMIGLLDYQFAGKESTMIRTLWRAIVQHHDSLTENDLTHMMGSPSATESDQASVYQFAVLLMCIDIAVIIFIFVIVYYRRRRPVYVGLWSYPS